MARVIEWATGELPASERRFLDLAKSDLPDSWTVIHGLRIRQPPADRELDFLIVDPARGALAVEVKGGRIERRGKDWFSVDGGGERHPIKHPGEQANAGVYALRAWLRDSASFRGRSSPPVHSAVAFPDIVRTHRELGPDFPGDTALFSDDLHELQAALDRIFETYLMSRGAALSPADVDALLRALELPEYALKASVAARVDRNRKAIDRLTEEQARTLDFLERQRRAAIEGSAGTGKTVLAEIKAERLAAAGQRVLLLCFNEALAEWLASRAAGFEARTFHAFCRERATKAGLAFESPKTAAKQREFWKDTAPSLLMDALESQPDERYDAIIVDEGQDFHEHWWLALESALSDERDGILYAFFDPNQNIYGGGPPDAFGAAPFSLTWNCRNTRRIATYASGLIDVSCEVRPGAPDGERVESLRYGTPGEMVDQVRKQLHRLVTGEKVASDGITVLSTHATNRSHLAHHRRLGNFNLVERPRQPTDIRFTSLHKFKGLESDVVILADVDGNPKSCSERHLYVAATRARALLIVLEDARVAA